MRYYAIEPEVAGEIGENSELDRSSGKLVVKKLHYRFDGWLGDELIESTPCFIITEQLAHLLEHAKVTGIQTDHVEVTTSEQFKDLYSNRMLPQFVWLKVHGTAGADDFGIATGMRLVVTERALNLLAPSIRNAASITPFEIV